MMLTVVVAGILGTLAVSSYTRFVQTAKNASAISDLAKIKSLIDRYRLNNNDAVPSSLADINAAGMLDPWGHAYVFLNFSTVHGNGHKRKDRNLVPINSQYDLYSMGANGRSASPLTAAVSRDDLIVANDGAFIGLASDY